MKKISLILLSLVMLCSCDFAFYSDYLSMDTNTFLNEIDIQEEGGDNMLRFLVLSDAHYNRELRDDGIIRNEDNLFAYLDKDKDIDAVFFLGDMIDDAVSEDYIALEGFIGRLKAHLPETAEIISAPGNHDYNKGSDSAQWTEVFKDLVFDSGNTGAYRISDTVIYKLDSAYRLLGRDQLDHLETALESTDATYKLILSHVPINLDHADQGLFQFVLADNNERGRLIRMFSSENALYLAGHHHKGGVLSSFSESFHEYVFPAFHRKDLLWGLESRGYYHILELNEDTGEVVIKSYQIQDESLEAERTINFSL